MVHYKLVLHGKFAKNLRTCSRKLCSQRMVRTNGTLRKHPPYSLSQGKQSKPRPVADMETGVCLRTSKFSAFTLFDYLTRPLPSQYYSPKGFTSLFLAGRSQPIQEGWAESCVSLCSAAAHSYQTGIIGQCPSASPSICLHVLPGLQGFSPLLSMFPPARIFMFFPGPLL